jgi:formylglycine-generating enzyme
VDVAPALERPTEVTQMTPNNRRLTMVAAMLAAGCGSSANVVFGSSGGGSGDATATDSGAGGIDGAGGATGAGSGAAGGGTGVIDAGMGGGALEDDGAFGAGSTEDAGRFVPASPSCAGGLVCNGESCCASARVPGGTYDRSYDGVDYTDKGNPATVGDFALDVYDATVGRFREFVAGYPANLPATGAGKNPRDASDPGWDAAWFYQVPPDQAGLLKAIKCDAVRSTWTDVPAASEAMPMNCLSWYVGFAFCIWDGGRLPTEAEWNYAAAGGGEQRAFPWSAPPTSKAIDDRVAVFCGASCDAPASAGSKSPRGDARWGHADMVGNVWQWVLDSAGTYPNPCVDCAQSGGTQRGVRGGAFNRAADLLRTARRDVYPDAYLGYDVGVRCARAAP